MAVTLVDSVLLANKFRGCLIGSLLGDCLGSPYEGEDHVSKVVLQKDFDTLEGPYFKAPLKQYTDDTAMTKCIAESFISLKGFNAKDLAKRFVKEYFREPKRGYGENVVEVFYKLRAQRLKDPFGPASDQFEGSGSYGNGGAMRIAPVALFCHHSYDELVDLARKTTLLTHTHKQGVDGAILQATAVHQSLLLDPKQALDVKEFTSNLKKKMKSIEKDEDGFDLGDPMPYHTQLCHVERLLALPEGAHDKQVRDTLGNSVTAIFSVPTAIFCFLRAQTPIPHIDTENPFRRTMQYAISLGGDTDTIASMAGAIAGAFYGEDGINDALGKHCESTDEVIALADSLLEISHERG